MSPLVVGDVVGPHDLVSIRGEPVAVPDPTVPAVHLQFRRYAGCPVCNVHLRSFTTRHAELTGSGVREVVVFHSSAATMREFQGALPYDAVADPNRDLYAEFGVQGELTVRDALRPRAWRAAASALVQSESLRGATGRGEKKSGLPADFLLDPQGRVLAVHYGEFVDDHWSVDTVLTLMANFAVNI